jgi:CheY-like chemotaxis protein
MPRVLVIEDDDNIRMLIRKALERGGHQVLEAANGFEGIAVFKFGKIDLVVTDLVMPGQEGVTTIQQVRKLDPDVPIIAISGSHDTDAPLQDAMHRGANMRLAKPFSFQDLVAAVDVMLGTDDQEISDAGG